jgi:high-affinity Fe2+/Pb2+ permease
MNVLFADANSMSAQIGKITFGILILIVVVAMIIKGFKK